MVRIGPYESLGELARGAMGVVHRARDPALGRDVAIKLMLSPAPEGGELERFRREARATARLRHPHIVALHTVGSHDGHPYLVMDLVEGQSLLDRLQAGGPIEPRQAAAWVRDLAEAVAYAHRQGVLHRDIKPANVLVDREGELHLADFGLARAPGEDLRLTRTGEVVGTPAYMAPEQASGGIEEVGPPADVYSLGATLFELLTGRPPFLGQSVIEVFTALAEQPAPDPRALRPEVPAGLAGICHRCLAKAPADRFPSAAALAEALEAFLRPAPAPAASPARDERPLLWGSLLALGALTLTLGVGLWRARAALAEERAARLQAEQREPPPAAASPALRAMLDAVTRREQGDLPGALAAVEAALRSDPALSMAVAFRADLRRRLGDPQGALEDYTRYLAAEPGATQAWLNRAAVLIELGQLEPAQEDLSRALALDPTLASAYRDRAGLRMQTGGDYEAVVADCSLALEHDPNLAGAWVNRAAARMALGQLALAQADAEQALALDPALSEAAYDLGLIHLRRGQLEPAEEAFSRALTLRPSAQVFLNRAMARVRLERSRDALEDCDQVLARNPPPALAARALAERGYAHAQLEQRDAARADWEQALRLLDADDPVAVDLRERLASD